MDSQIAVVEAEAEAITQERTWYWPMVSWDGSGNFWYAPGPYPTREEAEAYVRTDASVSMARIVRVVLPCREITDEGKT